MPPPLLPPGHSRTCSMSPDIGQCLHYTQRPRNRPLPLSRGPKEPSIPPSQSSGRSHAQGCHSFAHSRPRVSLNSPHKTQHFKTKHLANSQGSVTGQVTSPTTPHGSPHSNTHNTGRGRTKQTRPVFLKVLLCEQATLGRWFGISTSQLPGTICCVPLFLRWLSASPGGKESRKEAAACSSGEPMPTAHPRPLT